MIDTPIEDMTDDEVNAYLKTVNARLRTELDQERKRADRLRRALEQSRDAIEGDMNPYLVIMRALRLDEGKRSSDVL